jgi:hypothetical protein
MSILTNDYVQEYMRNRWLNLGDTSKIHTTNPFANRNDYEIENPHIFLLDYMRKPENFGFTCEVLFGKTLAPFQIAILRELWIRQFPAFIGCRGLGKCITGNSLVQTNRGISTIEAIVKTNKVKEPVYYNGSLKICGENGYKDVAYGWNNGLSETVKIKTRMGYELEGTKNHPIRVVKQKEIVWKNLEDVTKDDVVIIPERAVVIEGNKKIVEVLDGTGNSIKREVQTGLRGQGGVVEITQGLKEGETIIVSRTK